MARTPFDAQLGACCIGPTAGAGGNRFARDGRLYCGLIRSRRASPPFLLFEPFDVGLDAGDHLSQHVDNSPVVREGKDFAQVRDAAPHVRDQVIVHAGQIHFDGPGFGDSRGVATGGLCAATQALSGSVEPRAGDQMRAVRPMAHSGNADFVRQKVNLDLRRPQRLGLCHAVCRPPDRPVFVQFNASVQSCEKRGTSGVRDD